MRPPGPTGHLLRRVSATLLAASALLIATPAPAHAETGAANGANGVRLEVTPATVADRTDEVMVEVRGSGFSITANQGVGVYVAFGPLPSGDRVANRAYTDATVAYDGGAGHGTLWVRPSTPSGPNQARLQADGTFAVNVAVKRTFTAPDGRNHDGDLEELGIYAFAAHGIEAQASAFSQAGAVRVRFAATSTPSPSPKPAASATPRPRSTASSGATPAVGPVTPRPSATGSAPTPAQTPPSQPAASGRELPSGRPTIGPDGPLPGGGATLRPGGSTTPSMAAAAVDAGGPADAVSVVGPVMPLVVSLAVLAAWLVASAARRVRACRAGQPTANQDTLMT